MHDACTNGRPQRGAGNEVAWAAWALSQRSHEPRGHSHRTHTHVPPPRSAPGLRRVAAGAS